MRIVILVAAAMLLAGCSSTLKPATIDASTGYIATQSRISKGGVEIEEPFNAKYLSLLYVKTDSNRYVSA